MQAIVHKGVAGIAGVSLTEMAVPVPREGEVRVDLRAAGLNHRDLFVLQRHGGSDDPVVLGSDGAGVIGAVGPGVTSVDIGQPVLINPSIGWLNNTPAPPESFEILGFPSHGTFAQSVVVPVENVAPKPEHLSWEEAAVLPLGALTAYRALVTRGQVQSGQTVFIPGIGSGVATLLLQMAKAKGARVIVSSRSSEKLKHALDLNADRVVDNTDDWAEALADETVDLVIESVGAATFNRSLSALKKGGTIVTFGASAGDKVELDLRAFFYGQYNLLGTTMGSAEEFADMLRFVVDIRLKPVVDRTFTLDDYAAAFNRLENAEQFGKIALTVPQDK